MKRPPPDIYLIQAKSDEIREIVKVLNAKIAQAAGIGLTVDFDVDHVSALGHRAACFLHARLSVEV
jgi:hypothetical protein